MNKRLRLFIAIELPDAVKNELCRLIDALNAANTGAVQCVRPEGAHLTLKFLGNVDSSRVDTLSEALTRAVGGHTAFSLRLVLWWCGPTAVRFQICTGPGCFG